MNRLLLCLLIIGGVLSSANTLYKRDYENRHYYTIHTHAVESAKQIAHELGARFEGPVGELDSYYMVSIPKSTKLHKRDDNLVIQEQIPRKRLYKRAPPPPVIENTEEEYKINGGLPSLDDENGFQSIKRILNIQDPGFDHQWHLINREERGHDVNVTGVWGQGITGKGIVVAILDDGLELDHKDLKANYFSEGSYDFNDHVKDPKPRLADDTHGTRCAGEIAAVKNDMCGIGVAYDAKVAGIRILSGDITEADEAAALNYEYQKNHIYSCSWGPSDMGQVAEAPQGIVLDAIKNGIRNGRNGTGSIFVFASGNGGSHDDNCNFDGYTNSLYTITVGAIDKLGNHPYYSEKCAAQLVVTYSSGSGGYIYTTDVGDDKCSDHHGGTSAAAPLAAGVFALVLSVRPDLTWRDMQHLCVQSAIPVSLEDEDWAKLPSGRMFNHKYGYGVLDAYRIVELAKTFISVRDQTHLEVVMTTEENGFSIPDITPEAGQEIDKTKAFTNTLVVTQEMIDSVGLARLEHVTVTVNIEHERRGDLEILLESPNQVSSQLGTPRQFDTSNEGLKDWTFMSVKHWEENPVGNWTLRIIDGKNPSTKGRFLDWKLTLWGEIKEGMKKVNDEQEKKEEEQQSFLDRDKPDEKSPVLIYSLVSLFMVASIASTAFIVKRYMLSTVQEDNSFEFDNLLTHQDEESD